MAQPLTVALPPGLVLGGGCTISVAAIDASSGSIVTGVNVSNVTIEVDLLSGSAADLESGPFMLVPGPRG
jgi:hypothetical protein